MTYEMRLLRIWARNKRTKSGWGFMGRERIVESETISKKGTYQYIYIYI